MEVTLQKKNDYYLMRDQLKYQTKSSSQMSSFVCCFIKDIYYELLGHEKTINTNVSGQQVDQIDKHLNWEWPALVN